LAPTRAEIDPARSVALDVLAAVRERDAYVNLLLPALLAERGLAGRDAAFATELASGTLRMHGLYDAVTAHLVSRSLADVDPLVLDILRLGCHQLLSMRVPSHAAVSTSVDLVRARAGRRPAGFVNAVLRRVASTDLDGWVARVAPDRADDPLGHLAVRHSHPRWIVGALHDALGRDVDETERLLAVDNEPPAVTLAARPGRSTAEKLFHVEGASRGRWSPYAVRLAGGNPAEIPAVREGRAGVQDEGSQLVAVALARASLDGADACWLDLCAGPGGKAALLAGLVGERDGLLLASDRQPHRARLVARAVEGVSSARVIVADGTAPAWRRGEYDRVLLDAPCTGLGALRRRPEARWRRQPTDLGPLTDLQTRLLDAAVESARPGGIVAYATCSPHLAETHEIVAARLARSDVELVDARQVLPDVPDQDEPWLQLWPHRHDTDAMFLALLRRR
jgi:16S rRNA (cytosine967-C5)-methyltransferase